MECTFAAVQASSSKSEELALSVIGQSAPPAVNNPEPIIVDKPILTVVEEPVSTTVNNSEPIIIDKSAFSIIEKTKQITIDKLNFSIVDKLIPLTVILSIIDKPAPSFINKSGGI